MRPASTLAASITLAVLTMGCGGAIARETGSEDDASADSSPDSLHDSSADSSPDASVDVVVTIDVVSADTIEPDSTATDAPQDSVVTGYCDTCADVGYDADGSANPACYTCATLGYDCGYAADGCGNALFCGTCLPTQYCGGGGFNRCGGVAVVVPCQLATCTMLNIGCGIAADGCGGTIDCGSCPAPQTCGGGGTHYQCGTGDCVQLTCAAQNLSCGLGGDGCGNEINCGTCTLPQMGTCGGAGMPSQCGFPYGCIPMSCEKQGFDCGPAGDGCGNFIFCGSCMPPQTCGGGGYNKCG